MEVRDEISQCARPEQAPLGVLRPVFPINWGQKVLG